MQLALDLDARTEHAPRPRRRRIDVGRAMRQLALAVQLELVWHRPPVRRRRINVELVLQKLDDGQKPMEIAREVGCDHAYICRLRDKHRPQQKADRTLAIARRRCWECGIVAQGVAASRATCPRGHRW